MSDLATFLLGRIAEDEERARFAASTATGSDWVDSYHDVNRRREGSGPRHTVLQGQPMGLAVAQHVARWDPARVLAECEAKRRIVEDMPFVGEHAAALLLRVGKFLALPYAEHPDYQQDWKP